MLTGVKKRAENIGVMRYTGPILWGVCGSAVSCFVLLMIFSVILSASSLPISAARSIAMVALFISSLVGGFIASRILRERGLIIGALSGVAYFLLYMLIGIIFGSAGVQMSIILKLIIATTASAVGGIIGVNFKR